MTVRRLATHRSQMEVVLTTPKEQPIDWEAVYGELLICANLRLNFPRLGRRHPKKRSQYRLAVDRYKS
jgi:hypothetical protein